jgi:hypothetical protein
MHQCARRETPLIEKLGLEEILTIRLLNLPGVGARETGKKNERDND